MAKGSGQRGAADPDTIVREIEAAREDLAITLDAIAERVSPKRVAARSSERAKEVALQAKDVLLEKTAHAREVLGAQTATARGVVEEKTATARAAVAERTGHTAPSSVLDADPAATGVGGLPPTTGVQVKVPVLTTSSRPATHTGPVPLLDGVPREAVVGAVAALVALWLVRRRRRT